MAILCNRNRPQRETVSALPELTLRPFVVFEEHSQMNRFVFALAVTLIFGLADASFAQQWCGCGQDCFINQGRRIGAPGLDIPSECPCGSMSPWGNVSTSFPPAPGAPLPGPPGLMPATPIVAPPAPSPSAPPAPPKFPSGTTVPTPAPTTSPGVTGADRGPSSVVTRRTP
jgi:hypothetical protein